MTELGDRDKSADSQVRRATDTVVSGDRRKLSSAGVLGRQRDGGVREGAFRVVGVGAGDEQELVRPGERRWQGFEPVVIGVPELDAPGFPPRGFLHVPHAGDDGHGLGLLQQLIDDQAAQAAEQPKKKTPLS